MELFEMGPESLEETAAALAPFGKIDPTLRSNHPIPSFLPRLPPISPRRGNGVSAGKRVVQINTKTATMVADGLVEEG
ncbi:Hypothetical protein NTJ_03227 [Nesidiocoris tenuis]|uniref:Uncharacterized protein n=1 Tax=Nesidiocoris tenuis TaxID=355587 RepID=A0ABN7AGU3_9HEMI|nr:Hypothetical protein NTJ_03227 [Nesidiocoris tenuis]